MDDLQKRGLLVAGTRADLVGNRLVLVSNVADGRPRPTRSSGANRGRTPSTRPAKPGGARTPSGSDGGRRRRRRRPSRSTCRRSQARSRRRGSAPASCGNRSRTSPTRRRRGCRASRSARSSRSVLPVRRCRPGRRPRRTGRRRGRRRRRSCFRHCSQRLALSGWATSSPASPRVAGCRWQRVPTASTWPARSAAARGSPSATAPTMNTRRRRCGTPKKRVSRTRQARPYPRSASVPSTTPKSRPPFEERRPGTFSTRSHRGRTASMIRANSKKRPLIGLRRVLVVVRRRRGPGRGSLRRGDQDRRERIPERPVRTRSDWLTVSEPSGCRCRNANVSYVVVDGDSGPWSASTSRRQGSDSQKNTCRNPARASPWSSPPMPENSDPHVGPSPH